MTTRPLRTRLAWLLVIGSIVSLAIPGTLLGHSELQSSKPADGSTVASPFSGPIVLTFSEHLASGSKAELLSPNGTSMQAAVVSGATMTISLADPLDPGAYSVQWTSIADDGDLLRGIVKFTVAASAATPSPTTSPTPVASTSATATASASAPPSASASLPVASPSPSPGTPTSGGGSDVILPIVVALVVLGGGAAYLLRQRARPSDGA